jgi:RND family efflux transporter MFP subunit
LETLNVDIGSPVEKGDVLATVAVPELEKAYERQQATIERLKLDEKRYEQAKKLASALREQAVAEVAKTVAQLNADELEFNRVRELVANDAVAGRLLDEARKKFEASQAAKKAVEAALESAKANVFVAEAESLVAKEATTVAGKQLEEMHVVKSFATITAPFKGVITERHVDPGDLVRNIQMASDSSRKPLFCVALIDKVRVRIYVPENEAPWADKGDPVTLSLRSLPDWKPSEEIKISRVARSLDRSTQTMLVECDLLNNDNQLLPGMYGRATITLDEKVNALMLPASAVRYAEDGRAFVYIVQADSTIQIVDVQTGADDGKQIEITSDLDENARVVEAMIGRLADGQTVKVQE